MCGQLATGHIYHRKCCTDLYSAGTVGMGRCRTVDRAMLCATECMAADCRM